MRIQENGVIPDLFGLKGGVARRRYLVAGLVLFAIKYALDFLLTTVVFHRQWKWFPYLDPLGEIGGMRGIMRGEVDVHYPLSMWALALPFIWVGTAMTSRRIRSAGLPGWLVILFFVPILNLATIGLLCILPEKVEELAPPRQARLAGNATYALATSIPTCAILVWLGTSLLKGYGLGLFIALPFCLGFVSVLIFDSGGTETLRSCLWVAMLSVAIPGVALLFLAFEGVVCLIMALPLALPLACLGGAIAWTIQDGIGLRQSTAAILILLILYPPAVMCAEYAATPEPPLLTVRSTVEIDAPPETVWRHVVSFADLPAPTEWIFHTGIAYPIRARIQGAGPGAIRRCEFSTGPFVEPIQVWDEPRLLQFAVTQNPAPMEEWTPYKNIHPKHLDNYLVSRQGQFLLVPLAGGRTRLEGTTWYTHNLWPAAYWQVWSDFIIHRIHERVLVHIKKLAENTDFSGRERGREIPLAQNDDRW
jgi:uncharacterized membrane protein YhaH (DUF805 family)